jgi:hypothetical protein
LACGGIGERLFAGASEPCLEALQDRISDPRPATGTGSKSAGGATRSGLLAHARKRERRCLATGGDRRGKSCQIRRVGERPGAYGLESTARILPETDGNGGGAGSGLVK